MAGNGWPWRARRCPISSWAAGAASLDGYSRETRRCDSSASVQLPRLAQDEALGLERLRHPDVVAGIEGHEARELRLRVVELGRAGGPVEGHEAEVVVGAGRGVALGKLLRHLVEGGPGLVHVAVHLEPVAADLEQRVVHGVGGREARAPRSRSSRGPAWPCPAPGSRGPPRAGAGPAGRGCPVWALAGAPSAAEPASDRRGAAGPGCTPSFLPPGHERHLARRHLDRLLGLGAVGPLEGDDVAPRRPPACRGWAGSPRRRRR